LLDRVLERLAIEPPLQKQPSPIVRKTVLVDDPEFTQAGAIPFDATITQWAGGATRRHTTPVLVVLLVADGSTTGRAPSAPAF